MTSIESFFVLAAVVVLIGLVVWRRDVKTGRIMRTKVRGPVTVMRERFTSPSKPAPAALPVTGAGAAAADTASSAKVRSDAEAEAAARAAESADAAKRADEDA